MLIDWFTVGAQALNFLILVWLMKRYLYRPVLGAIAAREKRIAAEVAAASEGKAAAAQEREEFQHRKEELEQQRESMLAAAAAEASAERRRLMEEARQSAEAWSVQRRAAQETEVRHLNGAVATRVRQEVFSIVRKTLADLAGASLEERACGTFLHRLRQMDGAEMEGLTGAIRTASGPVLVRSAFDLPEEQRAAIRDAFHELFSPDLAVRWETAPDLVSGIELSANGRKIAWSIADYLTTLEKEVAGILTQPAGAGATP